MAEPTPPDDLRCSSVTNCLVTEPFGDMVRLWSSTDPDRKLILTRGEWLAHLATHRRLVLDEAAQELIYESVDLTANDHTARAAAYVDAAALLQCLAATGRETPHCCPEFGRTGFAHTEICPSFERNDPGRMSSATETAKTSPAVPEQAATPAAADIEAGRSFGVAHLTPPLSSTTLRNGPAPAVGICGASAPPHLQVAKPLLCILPAGHAGWHRTDEGTDFSPTDQPILDTARTAASYQRMADDPTWIRVWLDAHGLADDASVPQVLRAVGRDFQAWATTTDPKETP